MSFQPVELLEVGLQFGAAVRPVGRAARVNRRILFEFAPSFVADPLPISPFLLPARAGVHEERKVVFEGLPGLLWDSLPDGWGRLLLDREMDRQGVGRARITPLDRLAFIGAHGWGALTYAPAWPLGAPPSMVSLQALAEEVREVLEGDAATVVPALLALGGSSGGARPKVRLALRPEDETLWSGRGAPPPGFVPVIIKFGSREDPPDIGAVELAYARMAVAAGLSVSPCWLLSTGDKGPGLFATQRFDRPSGRRLHAASLAGLVGADPRVPSTDYESLLRVTRQLTRDQRAVDQVFRQMVFNVLAHNRDDHSKNFSFLMDETGAWRPSPAYDLTFSPGPGGEHWMSLAGEARNPGRAHLDRVAQQAGVLPKAAAEIIEEVRAAVADWPRFAEETGVGARSKREVGEGLGRQGALAGEGRLS